MLSKVFVKGFRYELANREFALRVVMRMADRATGAEKQSFWTTYSELERFNALHYRAAAQLWGFDIKPGYRIRLKARAVGWLLVFLRGAAMERAYFEIVKYAEFLRQLRTIGPGDASLFLNYMVEQEELQIKIMRMAFTERFTEVGEVVDAFFLKYNGVLPRISAI